MTDIPAHRAVNDGHAQIALFFDHTRANPDQRQGHLSRRDMEIERTERGLPM
jgi:hypothetical protein